MTMHDELLQELSAVASQVHVVAALRDDRLAFGSPDDARVFLPDMHIVTRATRQKYSYGTNDMDLLADVLVRLGAYKARAQGRTVAVFQVGDFLDLWREEPLASVRADAATRIVDNYPRLMNAVFSPTLKTRFLLGNHDLDLAWWPNFTAWERRYYLPNRGSTLATGIALHGDIFDWVEALPDALNHFFVYFFSPLKSATDHDLFDVKTLVTRQNDKADFSTKIAGPAPLGEVVEPAHIAPQQNLSHHEYLDKARAFTSKANELYNLQLRFAVIGHTHHARIALHDNGGDDFFALIDCGGWLETAHDKNGHEYPNQTLAIVSENEARIYLLER